MYAFGLSAHESGALSLEMVNISSFYTWKYPVCAPSLCSRAVSLQPLCPICVCWPSPITIHQSQRCTFSSLLLKQKSPATLAFRRVRNDGLHFLVVQFYSLQRHFLDVGTKANDFCTCPQIKLALLGPCWNRLCLYFKAFSLCTSHLPLNAQTCTTAHICLRCNFPTHH